MYTEDYIQTDPGRHLARLREYRDTVERLFPALTKPTLDSLSISAADALFVGLFMDYHPRRSLAVEKGVLLGTSTFVLAGHPKVSRVIGLTDGGDNSDDVEESEELEVSDMARAALAEHASVWRKIELHDSAGKSVGEVAAEAVGETADSSTRDESLIFLVNRPQEREEVSGDLGTIFDRYPQATVFLGNCRKSRGPFVQAGIADFLEEAQNDHHFRLAGDLGLGMTGGSLGVVYPDQEAPMVDEVLGEIGRQFSERLDPLRLLQREEELLSTFPAASSPGPSRAGSTDLQQQNDDLNRQVSSLTQQIQHLNHHYSSRRYKLADAAMNRLSRLRSLKRFIR